MKQGLKVNKINPAKIK